MLSWLVATSLRLRIALVAACAVLLVMGYRALEGAPLDVFPEFAPPIVEVQTEVPGLSSEQVEALVTIPLENALNGLPSVKTLRSKSVLGLSQVVLVLEHGSDHLRARQLAQERVAAEARRLPAAARAPVILPPLSSLSRVMKIGVTSKTLSQQDLSLLALWTVRPKLMAVRGVANVAIWGQRDRQWQVLVDPDALRASGVTLDAVGRAVGDAVALESGGFVDTPNQRMAIRHLPMLEKPEDLGLAILDEQGQLRLEHVADIRLGHPPPIGDAVINDGPGLLLIVEKQPEGNTLDVTRGVEEAIDALRPGLRDVQIDTTIFRPATFIERAIENLTHALLLGCVLVVLILLAFLFDWRTAFISLTAIPLSLVSAVLVLTWFGATVNTMVLAGLVIALGELVDDAIIDVENVDRRLRLNLAAGSPRSVFDVVLHASIEVRSAVVFATLIVALVFLPVFLMEGLPGAFFRPLAVAYVLAVISSLLVAMTVTPALAYMLLGRRRVVHREAPLARLCKWAYVPFISGFVRRPWLAAGVLVAAFALTGVAASRLGSEFLPDFQERDFLMHFVEKPGTSVEAMERITTRASAALRAIPGVRNFGAHIGRAEAADEVVGPNFTELWISVDEGADYEETVHRIEEVVRSYPGLYRDVLTYLRERIKEVLTGASASIVVRVYGPALETLRDRAQAIESALAGIPGVINLKVESQVLVPQVEVRLKPDAARVLGVTAGHVRRASTALLKGWKVGEVHEGQRRVDVVVMGLPKVRTDLTAVRDLVIDTPSGTQVRLGDVAEVAVVPTPNEIKRENAARRLDVTCDVRRRDLGAVAKDVEARLRDVSFEHGYHAEVLGEYAVRQKATDRLYELSALALLAIVLLVYADFQAWRPTLLVVLTIPFSLIGGIAAVMMSGAAMSLGSIVGFVAVLGIAARNGILMISHFRHLEYDERVPFGTALVIRGAKERLVPILMTAFATGLAVVPLVLAGNQPGHEIEHPLAVVILGGLCTSTLLTLLLLPPLYARFGKAKSPLPLPGV